LTKEGKDATITLWVEVKGLAMRSGPRAKQVARLALLLVLLAGCRQAGPESITLAGSTSVQPFAELLAEEYALRYPQAPRINIQGGGSTAGIQAATSGVADIGMSSRNLRADEPKLQAVLIAQDAIAIILNPQNSIDGLTLRQIRDIFSGRTRNWGALGWRPAPITVVIREEGSGTRETFEKLVLGQDEPYEGAIVQDSNGAVRVIVAGDPNAIGYISLGLVNQEVKAVSVEGIKPSPESIARGQYGLVRPFLFLVQGKAEGAVAQFIDFVLSPPAQELLAKEGLVKAR